MIRNATLYFTIAALIFAPTPSINAETINAEAPSEISTFVIPDGSILTSFEFTPPGSTASGFYSMTFQFQGGYGSAWDDYNDGGREYLYFNAPVSNLAIDFIAVGPWFSVLYGDTSNLTVLNPCQSTSTSPICPSSPGVLDLSGSGISFVEFDAYLGGYGGISSLRFSQGADPIPEPSSLLLLGAGLLGLVLQFRRKLAV